jgi:hypothetical protein
VPPTRCTTRGKRKIEIKEYKVKRIGGKRETEKNTRIEEGVFQGKRTRIS